ncbi:MAG: SGNH/GDSL hydrolase family protein [Thermodesulfobacteriota bacterium]|nr:SGNH/GDSL hydrolase family protein [Thermodesulfobacteriota bacterium]
MKKYFFVVGIFLLCLVMPFGATAFAYSQVVGFGDSLSDNGNADGWGLHIASNGPVWLDHLAGPGLLNTEFLDMAYFSAQTNYHPGSDSVEWGFRWQINQYINKVAAGVADSNALYTLWIGGNDLFNIATPSDAPAVIENAVTHIALGINDLVIAGAQNILVMNMPNLGITPLMNGQNGGPDHSADGAQLASSFNKALHEALNPYRSTINLFEVDVLTIMGELITDGYFDNYTNKLKDNFLTTDSYMFWDDIHPTTYAHGLIAKAAYNEVASVPIPGAIWLFGSGLVGLAGFRKKFKL